MLWIFRTGCEYLCKSIFCECNIKKFEAKQRTVLPTKHYNKYYTLHILLIFAYILYVFYTSSNIFYKSSTNFPLTYKNLVYSYQCTQCYWNFNIFFLHTTDDTYTNIFYDKCTTTFLRRCISNLISLLRCELARFRAASSVNGA